MKSICLDPTHSTTRLLITEQSKMDTSFNEVVDPTLSLCTVVANRVEGGLITKNCFKRGYFKNGNQWFTYDTNGEKRRPIDLNIEVAYTDLPLITIVTVVFNGEKYLEETIKSIINQTYPNVEYIIIDGGSTDNSLNIIRQYVDVIDYWVSEADSGIYDAMNKAIEMASGNWINFMNAGDIFYSTDTLDLVFGSEAQSVNEDIVYGNVHIRYSDFSRIQRAGKLSRLWTGMKFCHQSVFVKTKFQKLKKFNSSNKIAADLEFFYSAYKCGAHFKHVDAIIASVSTGGLSESNRLKTILASRDAVCESGGGLALNLMYYLFCINAMIRSWLKMILPKKLSRLLIKMKS